MEFIHKKQENREELANRELKVPRIVGSIFNTEDWRKQPPQRTLHRIPNVVEAAVGGDLQKVGKQRWGRRKPFQFSKNGDPWKNTGTKYKKPRPSASWKKLIQVIWSQHSIHVAKSKPFFDRTTMGKPDTPQEMETFLDGPTLAEKMKNKIPARHS